MTAKTHASHDLSARGRPESDHTEAVNHHGTGYCEAPSAADGALSFLAEADQTDDAAYVFRRANVRTAAFRLLLEGGHPVSVVEMPPPVAKPPR